MKPAKIKLPFGLKNNVLVHIANVESSAKCDYVCPGCNSLLIPIKGRVKEHHFRHKNVTECEGGLESAIHLAAKQEIMKKKQITLPQYISTASVTDSRGLKHTENKTIVQDKQLISFDHVQEEKILHEIKADILAVKDNRQLIIEIFYRHKVEEQKIEKIKKANISTIEINLSDLTPKDVKDMASFWLSINDTKRIEWLYNSKDRDIYPRLLKQAAIKLQKQEKKYNYEETRNQIQEQEQKAQLAQALEELKVLYNEKYITQLTQEADMHPVWLLHSEHLKLTINELPDFLNIDVPNGDWIYGCDRRVWQTAIYNKFICKNSKPYFSVKQVDDWLQNGCNFKVPGSARTVGKLARRYPELVPKGIFENIPSSWITLRSYFYHLDKLGTLIYSGNDRRHKGSCWFQILSKTN